MPDNQEDNEPSSSTKYIIRLLKKLGKDVTEENINALIKLLYVDDRKEY